jgi:hypothetical protein
MIKKLLLILVSFGMATEWGASISVRTPNDVTKPLDYEYSIKLEDTDGKLKYLFKRDWERELGEKYIDDVINFQTTIIPYIYLGVDYVDKESKEIDYITYNIGADVGYFKAGVSFKQTDEYDLAPLLNLAISKKANIKDLDNNPKLSYIIGISTKSNIQDEHIINIKSEVKKWLSKKVNVFALYKHEYYNEKEDFQFKVGLGVKL